ncbi:5150_t:CDS:2 [Paraglomus occultum]|uniref:5150_t:CDS:1 n=1 Tax=Paraglomus occultum TaxID=144539 RepID=A0A9N8VW11_9GLOM|nr:5150_t:CDS:2 [Paraglomus occultum]
MSFTEATKSELQETDATVELTESSTQEFETKQSEKGDGKYVETKIPKNNAKEISETPQLVTEEVKIDSALKTDTVTRSPFSVEDIETKIPKNNAKDISKTAQAVTAWTEEVTIDSALETDTVTQSPFCVKDVETKIPENNAKEISETPQLVTKEVTIESALETDTVTQSPFRVEDVETTITKNNTKEINETVSSVSEETKVESELKTDTVTESPFSVETKTKTASQDLTEEEFVDDFTIADSKEELNNKVESGFDDQFEILMQSVALDSQEKVDAVTSVETVNKIIEGQEQEDALTYYRRLSDQIQGENFNMKQRDEFSRSISTVAVPVFSAETVEGSASATIISEDDTVADEFEKNFETYVERPSIKTVPLPINEDNEPPTVYNKFLDEVVITKNIGDVIIDADGTSGFTKTQQAVEDLDKIIYNESALESEQDIVSENTNSDTQTPSIAEIRSATGNSNEFALRDDTLLHVVTETTDNTDNSEKVTFYPESSEIRAVPHRVSVQSLDGILPPPETTEKISLTEETRRIEGIDYTKNDLTEDNDILDVNVKGEFLSQLHTAIRTRTVDVINEVEERDVKNNKRNELLEKEANVMETKEEAMIRTGPVDKVEEREIKEVRNDKREELLGKKVYATETKEEEEAMIRMIPVDRVEEHEIKEVRNNKHEELLEKDIYVMEAKGEAIIQTSPVDKVEERELKEVRNNKREELLEKDVYVMEAKEGEEAVIRLSTVDVTYKAEDGIVSEVTESKQEDEEHHEAWETNAREDGVAISVQTTKVEVVDERENVGDNSVIAKSQDKDKEYEDLDGKKKVEKMEEQEKTHAYSTSRGASILKWPDNLNTRAVANMETQVFQPKDETVEQGRSTEEMHNLAMTENSSKAEECEELHAVLKPKADVSQSQDENVEETNLATRLFERRPQTLLDPTSFTPASMAEDVFHSMFNPGFNNNVIRFINIIFLIQFAIFAFMAIISQHPTVYLLIMLSFMLFITLHVFVAVVAKMQAEEATAKMKEE